AAVGAQLQDVLGRVAVRCGEPGEQAFIDRLAGAIDGRSVVGEACSRRLRKLATPAAEDLAANRKRRGTAEPCDANPALAARRRNRHDGIAILYHQRFRPDADTDYRT